MNTSKQDPLFVESISEALKEVVKALGGAKKVGQMLKPAKPADEAGRWLMDALNSDRREKLDQDQIMWLLREARRIGCHVAMNFICDDCSYSRTTPIEPEDEKARLQREFIEASKHMARIAGRIEQMSAPGSTLKSVS